MKTMVEKIKNKNQENLSLIAADSDYYNQSDSCEDFMDGSQSGSENYYKKKEISHFKNSQRSVLLKI